MIDLLQFVVLQDATVGSWLFAPDAAVQEECSVGPGTAQQAEGCNGSGASLTKPRLFFFFELLFQRKYVQIISFQMTTLKMFVESIVKPAKASMALTSAALISAVGSQQREELLLDIMSL